MATTTLESLGIDRLSAAERLGLIEQIWDSLQTLPAGTLPLTAAQAEELDRRVRDDDAHPDDVVAWSELRETLQNRYGK